MVAAAAPVVNVACALVPITETPVVKSERNDEQVEDGQSPEDKKSTRPILFNWVCSMRTRLSHPL